MSRRPTKGAEKPALTPIHHLTVISNDGEIAIAKDQENGNRVMVNRADCGATREDFLRDLKPGNIVLSRFHSTETAAEHEELYEAMCASMRERRKAVSR